VEEMAVIVTVVKVVAFFAIVGFSGGIGVWLATRMARKQGQIPQGESAMGYLRARLRRSRQARRELLTCGERIVAWTMVFLSVVFAPAGVIILLWGDSSLRFAGIAMLVLALVVTAVPISPILQVRVRRRQQASRGP
jgi:cytochrome b subunit of formate dehydrogenase